jgi:hypothetical protein
MREMEQGRPLNTGLVYLTDPPSISHDRLQRLNDAVTVTVISKQTGEAIVY